MSKVDLDLWPSAFGQPEVELPDTLLKKQASLLGEKTNHLVEARVGAPVHAKSLSDKIRLAFYLVAPRLGDYSYRLFIIEYGITSKGQEITGYPVKLLSDEERYCEDREAFIDALREVFASRTTLQVISAMMGDSAADTLVS